MPEATTGPQGASGDAGSTPDYQGKYNGLQAAFQRRTNEFTQAEQAWEAERERYEQRIAELQPYETRATEEQALSQRKAEYEALRAEFEPEPPTPDSHGGPRGSTSRRPVATIGTPRQDEWPIG